ncbi:SGNH/GDSL hydrolase family protein [Caulobacter segnis]
MKKAMLALAGALLLATSGHAAERLSPWVSAWSTGLVSSETEKPPTWPEGPFMVREVVRLTAGGPRVRLRLSNAFGTAPLRIDAAHVALSAAPASAAIVAGSDRKVTFDGREAVVIPAGAVWLSDSVALPVKALDRLAISLALPAAPSVATQHRSGRTTTYLATAATPDAADLPGAITNLQWLQLAGVEVDNAKVSAVATFGDSITDGSGAGVNRYERWPDILAERLQADPKTRRLAVINAGIGANRLLKDGTSVSGLARLDRDVFSHPGVRTLIVLIGVNDIGMLSRDGPVTPEGRQAVVEGLIAGYRQLIDRAHGQGIRVVGATILPFGGTKTYRSDADADADRQAVNQWIRTSGAFDAVVDLDAVTRDPAHPERLKAEYDSGDLLHPSPAGYRAMAAAIPLAVLK